MTAVLLLAAALITYNSTVQLVPDFPALYIPLSLLATGVLALTARRLQLTLVDLGLDAEGYRTGTAWGLAVAASAAIIFLIAVLVPAVHPLFDDERLAGIGPGLVAYRALLRIPLGTALLEEFAFRGVLLGAWRRVAGLRHAVVGSSIAFGLWHIRPAIELVQANGSETGGLAQAGVVTISVIGTAIAGLFFAGLRLRSKSLLAPFIAHAAINSSALIAAALIGDLL